MGFFSVDMVGRFAWLDRGVGKSVEKDWSTSLVRRRPASGRAGSAGGASREEVASGGGLFGRFSDVSHCKF